MTFAWRSLLFVAADDAVRVAKVAERGADAVILDLEDAVLPDRKQAARLGLPDVIDDLAGRHCPLVVRVNSSWREVAGDLEAAVRTGVSALMIPKVEDQARLIVLAEMVAELATERDLALPPRLIALIESPAGIAALDAVARAPGVIGLALGTEDFSLQLGVAPTADALDLPCRLLALAASRARIMALALPVSIATIADEAGWKEGARRARAMGATGAMCIHPRQVAIANEAFTPSEGECAAASRIVAAWRDAGGRGAIQVDGKMIDLPVLLAAERLLARSGRTIRRN